MKAILNSKRQTWRWLAASLLFAVCGWLGWQWHFWWRRPVGDGSVAIPVNRALFAHVWTSRPVLLVGIGDSVTAGFGASAGKAYFDRLIKSPPDEFAELQGLTLATVLQNLRVTNLAISGSTSLQHVRTELPKLPVQPTNVLGLVLMTTGGNDIIHNYGLTPPSEGAMFGTTFDRAKPWIDNFEKRLAQMASTIQSCFPGGCHIFLANIYDPTDGLGDIERAGLPTWPDGGRIHAAYNEVIARFVRTNPAVHMVDIHAAFLGHGIHCTQFWRSTYHREDAHYWYHANLEDPNDRGYDALRRLFLREIASVMNLPITSPRVPPKQ